MSIPVRFQMVVNCHPGDYHLFEMNYDGMYIVYPGQLLMNVPGIPNVVGQQAEFDNKIVQVIHDGSKGRELAKIFGFRAPAETIDEVKENLPEWEHIRQIPNANVGDEQFGAG